MDANNSKELEKNTRFFVVEGMKLLDEISKELDNSNKEIENLKIFLLQYWDKEKNFRDSIGKFKSWLNSIDFLENKNDKKKEQLINEFSQIFLEYHEKINNIISILKKLENINKDIIDKKVTFESSLYFNPPKIESSSFFNNLSKQLNVGQTDGSNQDSNITPSLVKSLLSKEKENNNEDEDKDQSDYLDCKNCKKKANFMYKNNYYCRNCWENIYLANRKAYLYLEKIFIDKKNPAKIYRFLNSVSICIKLILLKCDYLVKQSNIESVEFNENGKINSISFTHDIDYPFIKDPDNINSYITFLGDIEQTLNKECKFNNFKHENFFPSKLNSGLIKAIKYILTDENDDNKFKNDFYFLENDYLDEDYSFSIHEIEMDKNYITYVSPKRLYNYFQNAKKKKIEQNMKKKNNNKIVNKNLKNKENVEIESNQKKVKREKLSYEEFSYMIEYLYDNTDKNLREKEDEIIRKMKNHLIYEPFNYTMKYLFNDFLITTEKILNLSINEMIMNFPDLNELYEYKVIVDDLIIKELGLKEYMDYQGNFINASKDCLKIKGIRMHIFIPSGWVGIGIKYEPCKDNEWTDSLLGIGENLSSNEVKKILTKIIINDFIKEQNQNSKMNESIEYKAYFNTKINIIETHSGFITFYDSKYRIVFMVKIKKNLLINSDNISLCNISKDNMKIQTILFKKISY